MQWWRFRYTEETTWPAHYGGDQRRGSTGIRDRAGGISERGCGGDLRWSSQPVAHRYKSLVVHQQSVGRRQILDCECITRLRIVDAQERNESVSYGVARNGRGLCA